MTDKTAANDAKIKALLAKVDLKRTELGTKPKARWITNGIFKYPDGNHININTVKEGRALLDALAFLLQNAGTRAAAAEQLGVVDPEPYKHCGYTVDEWREDFRLRLAINNYDRKKKELAALEKKLSALISEGTRTEMELDSIAALLD